MRRALEPEWLDELRADDPAALRSRRDLALLNRLMGHASILRNLLKPALQARPPRRIAEVGAGDGRLMLQLANYFAADWRNVELLLIDRQNAISAATRTQIEKLGWSVETVEADVFDWIKSEWREIDLIIANLFLHHFSEGDLKRLFALAADRSRFFAACEPRRAAFPFIMSRMLGVIGCNAVTRHDAPLSVRAGFDADELSAMWPKDSWRVVERPAGLFSHVFFARAAASEAVPTQLVA